MKFVYKDSCLIDAGEIQKTGEDLIPYLQHLNTISQVSRYEFPESFINLPFDGDIVRDVLRIKEEKVSDKLKYIILVGIGGSNLGAKAIYDSLHGHFDVLEMDRYPKIIFFDTNDLEFSAKIENLIKTKIKSPEEIIVIIASKSGTTAEININFEFIERILSDVFERPEERFVVITDDNSKMQFNADKKNISVLSVPEKIGGRYSVFSVVGLFPLACAGIDIENLLEGAREMRTKCVSIEFLDNPAILSAIIIYLNYKNGKIINDNFFFHPELESLGKWYRQLMAESLGREKNIDGDIINAGITPTVSIGSTDLHSMAQLYLAGPKDKFTSFVWSVNTESMEKIYNAVKISYKKKKIPFSEITLLDISAWALGGFMQFKMMEIIMLANLMKINAFNQSGIDDLKKEINNLIK